MSLFRCGSLLTWSVLVRLLPALLCPAEPVSFRGLPSVGSGATFILSALLEPSLVLSCWYDHLGLRLGWLPETQLWSPFTLLPLEPSFPISRKTESMCLQPITCQSEREPCLPRRQPGQSTLFPGTRMAP